MHCPSCNNDTEFTYRESDEPTGVIAPDGYAEVWHVAGYECNECGTYYDADEVEND